MTTQLIKTTAYVPEKHFGWELGASLYVPALHPDLLKIGNAEKIPYIKSMIICTEDAVAERDVEQSIQNLRKFLPFINSMGSRYRFIRPRNPDVLKRILDLPGIEKMDGFVLPKFDQSNRNAYLDELRGTRFKVMPTLETADVFNQDAMQTLALSLAEDTIKPQLSLIRIGGNDLLSLLGLRRPRGMTLYETPLGSVISQLVTTFKPLGFALSAPVYEYLADSDTLSREIVLDLAHGLTTKTAIHPSQIPVIEKHYSVSCEDHEAALAILDKAMPAVFKLHNAMCEGATHSNWAQQIVARYHCYGHNNAFSGMNTPHGLSSGA
jgi:citrate lyase beta subunit